MRNRLVSLLSILLLAVPATSLADKPARKAKNPVVEFVTSMGTIQIELFADKAPNTVENVVKYVKSGHYDGTIFHRVIDNFMIQGGGFDAKYNKKPTRAPIKNEADNGLTNDRGTVAMARTPNPHSAAAQFFINVKNNDFLNHQSKTMSGWGYCVFGKVVKGMEVVDKMKKVPTGAKGPFEKDAPLKEVLIKKARAL